MTKLRTIQTPALYQIVFICLANLTVFGCTSFEYGNALKSGEQPWGQCKIEMISEYKRLKGKSMDLYLLKREEESGTKLETPKIWLEGHTQTKDFDEEVWTINFDGKKEKWTGSREIDGEKIQVTASICTNQINIFGGGGKNSPYNYSLSPSTSFVCNAKDPQVFPEFRAQLLNSKGQWFRLDLNCKLNK